MASLCQAEPAAPWRPKREMRPRTPFKTRKDNSGGFPPAKERAPGVMARYTWCYGHGRDLPGAQRLGGRARIRKSRRGRPKVAPDFSSVSAGRGLTTR